MPTEKEIKTIKLATLYELRLILDQSEKTEYTKDEMKDLLDQIALAEK